MQFAISPRRIFAQSIVVLMLAAFTFSCSKESKLASHIPKEATGVLVLDVKSLAVKSVDFQELMTMDGLKKAFSNLGDSAANEIKNSGIDILNKAYFFGTADSANNAYGAAIVAMKDGKKFEEFLKKVKPDVTIAQEGSFKTAAFEDNAIVGWNDTECIVVFAKRDPKTTLTTLMNLKKEESLPSANETFRDLDKQNADIAGWVNFESVQKLTPPSPMAPQMDLKGTYMTATCNFENGQIVLDGKYSGSADAMSKLNIVKSGIGGDVVKVLPGNTVIALGGFGIDMEKFYSYLESLNMVQPYDQAATQAVGMSIKDLLTTFSGDIAATVNGVTMKDVQAMDWSTGQPITRKEPSPDYCVALGIANKDRVGKVLSQFSDNGMLVKTGNVYSLQNQLFIIDQGNTLVITGSEGIKQNIVDGKGEKLSSEYASMLTSNASAAFVSFANIPESAYAGNPKFEESIKGTEIDDITYTGQAIKDNASTGKLVVRFKNKDENALVTISRLAKKQSEKMKAQQEAIQMQMDSTAVSEDLAPEPVINQ